MAFEIPKQDYSGEIKPTTLGVGDKAVTVGGENSYPFHTFEAVSYTHLTLPTTLCMCRSRWSPYH